jgi:hypothetical protein
MKEASRARPSGEERLDSGGRGLFESNREVIEQALALAAAIERAGADWRSFLRDQLERRPYVTLGTAAAFGYVLGAGVSPAAMRQVAAGAGRMVLMTMVRELVKSESPSASSEARRDSEAESAQSAERRTG